MQKGVEKDKERSERKRENESYILISETNP